MLLQLPVRGSNDSNHGNGTDGASCWANDTEWGFFLVMRADDDI